MPKTIKRIFLLFNTDELAQLSQKFIGISRTILHGQIQHISKSKEQYMYFVTALCNSNGSSALFLFSLSMAPISILRRSLGLPATTFRGSPGSFKGSSLIPNGSCAEVFCFAYDALCSFYNSVLSDNVTFSGTLSGMLAYHSSNRFI